MIELDELRQLFSGAVRLSEPLSKYTTFKIGGPADWYLEPEHDADVVNIVRYLREHGIRYVVIGNGSNVLIADEGYRGAVINLEHGFGTAAIDGDDVVAGAGIRLAQLVDFCIQHSFQGMEMLAGIPGTLGGAVIMNAGAYGGEISEHMVTVDVVRNDAVLTVPKSEAGFAYRTSDLQADIVLRARFRLPRGEKEQMKTVRRETMLKRNAAQPVQFPNAGSIFKNPPGQYAAVLIQECGLKGTRIGGGMVSEQHANFIVNNDRATARDIVELITFVRDTVRDKTNVNLALEVKLIGFDAAVTASLTTIQ